MTPPDQLIAGYLDDALTPAQHAELTAWLQADPAHLRRFVEANIREQHLRLAVQGRGELRPRRTEEPARGWARLVRFPQAQLWWAAAASVAVLLGVIFAGRTVAGGAVRAEVVSTADARLAGHPVPLRPGEQIALRALRLQSGSLRLRLANGVVLDIAGPMEGRFESAMRLRVTGGKVTAEVGAEGKGFTIETAEARVVDLGTRFGVDVSPGGGTDVVVFEGQVEIYEPRASRQAVDPGLIARLDAGEAVRVNRAQEPSRIVFVVQQPDEGDWTTRAEPPGGAVITHVADNRALADTRRFYRVSTGGMTAGAPARHMQRARWFPYRGDDLPDWLEGADLVETFGLDKWKEDFALTVTLGRPALLCVFQDSRVPPPEWLRDGFTDSGFRLQIRRLPGDERQPGVEPVADVPFSVWTREVHRAGTVALGPPRGTEAGGRGRMYGVAARPLPAASPVLPPPRP